MSNPSSPPPAGASRRVIAMLAVIACALVAWLALRTKDDGAASDGVVDGSSVPPSAAGKRLRGGDDSDTEATAGSPMPWDRKAAQIAGRVHDEAGAPVGGAMVCAQITQNDVPTAAQRTPTCTKAGADGRYLLASVPPVRMSVSASAPTYIPSVHRPADRRQHGVQPRPGTTVSGVDIELASGGVEIRGVVKDIAGGTIEGAQVMQGASWRGRGGAALAHTDAEGMFVMWVAPGEAYLSASAEGYTERSASGKAPGYTFELLLTPESIVGGRVVDGVTGKPVADARVEVSGGWSNEQTTYTDEDGRFRVDRLEPGRYRATAATADKHGTSNESREVGLGQTVDDLEVRMFPAASLSGTIMIAGATPTPCANGSISVVGRLSKHTEWKSSDPEGAVTVIGLLPDTYDVQVSCEGYADADAEPVVLAEAPVGDLIWQVEPGLVIEGIVVDAKGEPVAGATVHASSVGGAGRSKLSRAWSPSTGKDGRFALEGLRPGDYEIGAAHDDYLDPDPPLTHSLVDGEPAELRLTLEAGGSVHGRVVDAQRRPVAGAQVNVARGRWGGASGHTGDDGSFVIDAVPPGDHRVVASSQRWSSMRAPGTTDDDVQGVEVTVRAGEVSEVELEVEEQFGTISGRVIDADGAPVDDAFVSSSRESDSAKSSGNRARQMVRWGSMMEAPVLTDADGTFTLTEVPMGKHTVIAQRKGGGEGTVEHIEVGATGVVLQFAEGSQMAGRVRLAGGGAPRRFSIAVSDEAAGVYRNESFHDTEGAWTVSDLPPGKYVVAVSATEGAADTTVTLVDGASRDDVELVLTPRVDVSGTVVDMTTGAPIPNMTVTIGPLKGSMSFSFSDSGDQEHVTDDAGKFTVRAAPAGPVRVMVMGRNFFAESELNYGWTRLRANIPADAKTHTLPPLRLVEQRVSGRESAGDLGFSVKDSPPGQEPEDTPLQVAVVRPGGPAAQGGLKIGDVIVEVGGHAVTGDDRYLYGALTRVKQGDEVVLGLADGRTVTIVAGKPV